MVKEQHEFHGYIIKRNSVVIGKNGKPLKWHLRKRNGGGFDKRITLRINKKSVHFTLSRLIAQCFHGPVYGLEANHDDRDTMNCHADNITIDTRSENQQHWREDEKRKRVAG